MSDAPISVVYKRVGDSVNTLHWFEPLRRTKQRAPVLVMIPGGGWHRNDGMSMYHMGRLTADELREQGFGVAAVDYRGCVPDGASMADVVGDVLDAMGYIAQRADEWGADPDRLVTLGHSAGGHLALQTAYMDPHAAPRTVETPFHIAVAVGWAPALTLLPEERDQYVYNLTDPDEDVLFPGRREADYRLFSPLHLTGKTPVPTFVAAGEVDQIILPVQTAALADKLAARGVPVERLLCRGGEHCFLPRDGSVPQPDFAEIQRRTTAFVLAHVPSN